MNTAITRFKKSRGNQRGAVALEYILIASLVAIALIGSFVYFRGTLKSSISAISDTTANAVTNSITTGTEVEDQKVQVNPGTIGD